MSVWRQTLSPLLGSLLLLVGGCEIGTGDQTSEGGMGGSGSGNGQYAEGGMGGSGSGTTTGYGSIYVNEHRYYQIAENAEIMLDGEIVAANSVNAQGMGLPMGVSVEFVLADDADEFLGQGTALAIAAHHRVIGPVTALDPLQVLGQTVMLTDSTHYDDIADPAALEPGDIVQVAGMVNRFGTISASRLATPASEPLEWQLIGRVTATDEAGFSIGRQSIELGSAHIDGCGGLPEEGHKILIRATRDTEFTPGAPLDSTVRISCLPEGLSLFGDQAPEQLPATVEAIVTEIDLSNPMLVNLDGQWVDLGNVATVLIGTLDNLRLGVRLEVDGTLNTETGIIQAERVRLREPASVLEIVAPISSVIGESVFKALGREFRLPAGDSLPDGINDNDFVLVNAFVEGDKLFAEAVTSTDEQAVRLLGQINDISETSGTLMVAGIAFLLESAEEVTTLDEEGNLITVLVNGTCKLLLSLICQTEDAPPSLDESLMGMRVNITGAGFEDLQVQGGSLFLYQTD